jgi:hypothetical protein
MTVTLCLVTKGREKYVKQLLDSLNLCLQFEGVYLRVILNGAPEEIIDVYNNFQIKHQERVKVNHLIKNDARASSWWHLMNNIETDWITFPGDDDILNPDFFKNFEAFELIHKSDGAIATSMNLIDSQDNHYDELRRPSFDTESSTMAQIARGFHECPFLWPGLLIRKELLPKTVPNSRYAFDWWFGLYLILTTKVSFSEKVMINYRVHEKQDSSLSPLNRKNLEALIHLGSLADSPIFIGWLKSLKESDLCTFIDELMKYPPLYNDYQFASALAYKLSSIIKRISNSEIIESKLILYQCNIFQVLLGPNQAKHFSLLPLDSKIDLAPNFSVKSAPSSCHSLNEFTNRFKHSPSDFSITIYCKHSKSKYLKDAVKVNCARGSNYELDSDTIIFQIQQYLEVNGKRRPSITPAEFKVITIIRKFKFYLPAPLRLKLQKILKK